MQEINNKINFLDNMGQFSKEGVRQLTEYYYDKYTLLIGIEEKVERGEYIETIHAEDGTYPDDGVQESHWYLKIGEYTEVNLLKPSGGEVIDKNIELSWTTSKHGNDYVEVELSLDGGVHWEYLTYSLITTFTYPMSQIKESSFAKIRVRSNGHYLGDGEYSSDWLEMKSVFTINHQDSSQGPNHIEREI